jgi:hypothetical protein
VLLFNWKGLGQNIETSTHHVNIKDSVVPNKTEYSLIEVSDSRGFPSDNNARKRERLDNAFSLGEGELVVLVSHELESSWQVVVVLDLDQPISRILNCYFTKLDRVRAEFNVKALSFSSHAEVEFVTSIGVDLVVGAGDIASCLRSVLNSDLDFSLWRQGESIHVDGEAIIVMIIYYLLYVDVSVH